MILKKHNKTFILGILIGSILTSTFTPAIAETINKTIDVLLNNVNIQVDDKTFAKQNENYTLSNGEKVPYSILYKGTTYLPMRKVAEALGKEVGWNQETKTASIKDKSLEYVNVSDDKKQKIHIEVVKIGDKYYDLSTVLGENFYYKTNLTFCKVNGKTYIATNNEEGIIDLCGYYVNLILNRYQISQGHENPNFSGRIELDNIKDKYTKKDIIKEYDGANVKTFTTKYKFDLGKNKYLKITFVQDATKYDSYLDKKSDPQDVYVNLDEEDDFAVDIDALHNYLSIDNLPKIYYDEVMKCYVIELIK